MTYGDNPDNSGPVRSTERRLSEARDIRRTRREQIARLRSRVGKIHPAKSSHDLNALLGVVKAIMDIISDDGEDDE